MSRTYRNRITGPKDYYWQSVLSKKDIALYYSDKKCWDYRKVNIPRWFRNFVNRDRRRKDKHEIHKSLYNPNYEEQCSNWNCKDSNHWGYW